MTARPRHRATSIAELAALAGVSPSTVSRALADNPAISARTRERIGALARAHGFQPNVAARNLRLGRTGAIGVLLPLGHETQQHLTDPFIITLLGHLADAIAGRGYDLLLSRVFPRDAGWLDAFVESGRADGVIVIGQSDQAAVLDAVGERYRPLVVWGSALAARSHLTIGSDNYTGGRLAGEHLIERGRTRPLFVGSPRVVEFGERYRGFRDALASAGITPDLLEVHVTADVAYREMADWLAAHPAPDAIFAASDVVALSTLRALGERGLELPGDVSLIGYDDVPLARHTHPPLTTVRQNLEQGARALCDTLFARLSGEEAGSVRLVPQLIVRATS